MFSKPCTNLHFHLILWVVLQLMHKTNIETEHTFQSDGASFFYHFWMRKKGEERVTRKAGFQMGAASLSCCPSAQLQQQQEYLE